MKKRLFLLPLLGLFLLASCDSPAPEEATDETTQEITTNSTTTAGELPAETSSVIVESTSTAPAETETSTEAGTGTETGTEATGTNKDTGWLPGI